MHRIFGLRLQHQLAFYVLVVASAIPVFADTPVEASVTITRVFQDNLLPIKDFSGRATIPGIPAFKFFENGALVGVLSGALPANVQMSTAIHTIPAGFSNKGLKDELTALNLPASTSRQTVVIFVMNGHCPPCDQIVRDVREKLSAAGWEKAKLLFVNLEVK
jgi:hypothetical protein